MPCGFPIYCHKSRRGPGIYHTQLLTMFEGRNRNRLQEMITGSKTCFIFYEYENKNNKVWVGGTDERSQTANRRQVVRHILYALYFHIAGMG